MAGVGHGNSGGQLPDFSAVPAHGVFLWTDKFGKEICDSSSDFQNMVSKYRIGYFVGQGYGYIYSCAESKAMERALSTVFELLGTPTESDLEFVRNEEARNYIRRFNPHPRQPLATVFQHVNPVAIDLVDRMLTFDPTKRITALSC
ncbi:mitogen-activated protein kinase 3 [Tripterygium wilfordii]|uniref:Mitogen-activated protein kinase 3 n=1 Tax=Tripterygium wilfordii TaxID=458696 RepID=A0A7J7DYY1_TRIWF|nr:mitogen-activated protein kinase 3 [Tripterygium wilfordii]